MKHLLTIKKAGDKYDEVESGTEDQDSPIGTKKAGYAGPEEGPFKCANCVHFKEVSESEGRCNQPDVVADPEMKKDQGAAVVQEGGCCNMFNPGGY